MKKAFALLALTAASLLVPAEARADPVVLTFDELRSGEQVLAFYNGGLGGLGSGPGPDFGAVFSSSVVASGGAGGSGNRIFFRPTEPAVLNVAGGFVSALSFQAGTPSPTLVSVYSGLNGTGDLLAQISLMNDPMNFNLLLPYNVAFAGVGRSAVFGGLAGFTVYDSIAFTPAQAAAVPEPTTLLLLGTGLAGAAGAARSRRQRACGG